MNDSSIEVLYDALVPDRDALILHLFLQRIAKNSLISYKIMPWSRWR